MALFACKVGGSEGGDLSEVMQALTTVVISANCSFHNQSGNAAYGSGVSYIPCIGYSSLSFKFTMTQTANGSATVSMQGIKADGSTTGTSQSFGPTSGTYSFNIPSDAVLLKMTISPRATDYNGAAGTGKVEILSIT